jgi:hypothetical protein
MNKGMAFAMISFSQPRPGAVYAMISSQCWPGPMFVMFFSRGFPGR